MVSREWAMAIIVRMNGNEHEHQAGHPFTQSPAPPITDAERLQIAVC